MTGFSSFNNSTSERVLSLLEASNFRLRELVQFGVDDGSGNGTSCCGIEVRTDKHATKLSNMIIARFGEGEIWSEKVRCLSKTNPSPRSRPEWMVFSEELCIWSSCFLSL